MINQVKRMFGRNNQEIQGSEVKRSEVNGGKFC
jgi:hypothetical protein